MRRMFVLTLEMMTLNKPHNAIVNDVEDARFIEHFQYVFMFRAGLEPQQWHSFSSVADHEFHDCLFCPFRCEEEHHDFRLETFLNDGANGSTEDGSACITWMDWHQTPPFPVKVVNGLMGWFLGVESSSKDVDGIGFTNRTNDGGVGIPKHGYLLPVFFFNHCSSPQNSSIKTNSIVKKA